ncbi:MAG: glycerol-3-phosphate dehydrogenase/oxidase [Venatoribacter sp.]
MNKRVSFSQTHYDLIVIGGGITGAGILLEAAKQGLKALLVEQRDFAWGTSSRSSKMVHGGLRYLASGDFKLTRDAVRERRKLLNEAPGLVDKLHFVMPHYRGGFPGPKLFSKVLGVYDFLAGQQDHEFYPASQTELWVSGLEQKNLLGITRFADAVVDDARLVLRVLHEARLQGAEAYNYVKAVAYRNTQHPELELEDVETGERFVLQAKVVINATGAWTDNLRQQLGKKAVIRPLRGSHLMVPFWRLPMAASLSFQHPEDKRPVFVFPWEGITVIGTTDLDHSHSLNQEARISSAEIDYLLNAINFALPKVKLTRDDIQASIAGVRPVVAGSKKDPSKERREHAIWNDNGLISVAGGKLTTFRLIAQDVLNTAKPYLPKGLLKAQRSNDAPLFITPKLAKPAQLDHASWQRLLGRYGGQVNAVAQAGMHKVASSNTLWGELVWALNNEAVVHLDDLLLRRTRLGVLLANGAAELQQPLQVLCQEALGWSNEQFAQEWQRYLDIWQNSYAIKSERHD